MVYSIDKEFNEEDLVSLRMVVPKSDTMVVYNTMIENKTKQCISIKDAYSISTTHRIIREHGVEFVDLELFWKLQGENRFIRKPLVYVPKFTINRAIECVTDGSALEIKEAESMMNSFFVSNNIKPLTPCYVVTDTNGLDGLIMRLCVGY